MHRLSTRWSVLLGTLVLMLALAACDASAAPSQDAPSSRPAATSDAAAGGQTIAVTANNFSFALPATAVSAGKVTFTVRNDGSAPHDFAIRGNGVDAKTPVIKEGETATLTVDLRPGQYTYLCTVGGHARMGMEGMLTVS